MLGIPMVTALLDELTSKFDVMGIKNKDELHNRLATHKQSIENLHRSQKLIIKNIRLDRTEENTSKNCQRLLHC